MPLAVEFVAVPANNLTVTAPTWFCNGVTVLVDRELVDEEDDEEDAGEGPELLELLDWKPDVETGKELVDDSEDERVEGVGLDG